MPKKINIKGVIISNDEKWIYDWFEMDNTTPNDVLNELPNDNSPVEVVINSGGGDVYAGSEIYTTLKDYPGEVTVKIVGIAASAASVIAMCGKTLMSPTAQMMIHNVSSIVRGDYRAMQHEAGVIENYNKSIANAYQLKSGKNQDELLELMNKESWFTAQQALELNLIDEIMFQNEAPKLVASMLSNTLPQNVIEKVRNMKGKLNLTPLENIDNDPEVPEVPEVPENNVLEEEKQKLLLEIELS